MQDTVVFLRENILNLIKEGTGPEMSMMVSMIGTDTVMKLITNNYQRYKENKAALKGSYKAYVDAKKAGLKAVK
jgi:predicted lipoprotein